MENELTIEQLSAYLPYGLRFQSGHYLVGVYGGRNDITRPILLSETMSGPIDWEANMDMDKPLLRPLSQLTKTIEHKGERFVPMIELFRLNTDDEHFNNVKDGLKITRDEWLPKRILCATRGDMIIEFDSLKISFRQYDDGLGWDNPNAGNLALIEKLHSWHFDTFGLLQDGLAIPIPSIEQP